MIISMRKLLLILLILTTMVAMSGCWDSRELDNLGLVMAVGIDKSADQSKFTVTVQIAKPSFVGGGSSGGGGGGAEHAVWTAQAEGKTIFEAIRNLAKFSSRRIMWAHNSILIIGESLAREDITPVVDFFTHNPELRMKTWVAVAHGDAKPYIAAKTGMENVPGLSTAKLFEFYQLPGESVQSDMTRLFRDFKSETVEPLVSSLNFKKRLVSTGDSQEHGGQEQVVLEGAAVFKGVKMVGFITPEEARGVAIERSQLKGAIITVPVPGNDKKYVSVEISGLKVKINSAITDDIPSISIKLSCSGNIAEQDYPVKMPIEEFKNIIAERTALVISNDVRRGINKVQKELKSDVLRFGRIIHINHRMEWYARLKDEWNDVYPQVPVTVDTKVEINSSVLFQRPMFIEKK